MASLMASKTAAMALTARCTARSMPSTTVLQRHVMVNGALPHSSIFTCRLLSTVAKSRSGLFGNIRGRIEDRQKKNDEKRFADQIKKMAKADKWTLQDYADELKSVVSSWSSKIPGIRNMPQIKQAQEAQKVVEGFMETLGKDATAIDVRNISRTDKLKVSIRSGMPLTDLNMQIKQLESMDIMFRVIHKMKKEGKPVPATQQEMKTAIQLEGNKVITREEKKAIRNSQAKQMKGMARGR